MVSKGSRKHAQYSNDTSSEHTKYPGSGVTIQPMGTKAINPGKLSEKPSFIIKEAPVRPDPEIIMQVNASDSSEKYEERRPPKPQNTFVGGIIRKKSVPKKYSHKENQSLVVTPEDFTPYKHQKKIVEDSFEEDYGLRSRKNI